MAKQYLVGIESIESLDLRASEFSLPKDRGQELNELRGLEFCTLKGAFWKTPWFLVLAILGKYALPSKRLSGGRSQVAPLNAEVSKSQLKTPTCFKKSPSSPTHRWKFTGETLQLKKKCPSPGNVTTLQSLPRHSILGIQQSCVSANT